MLDIFVWFKKKLICLTGFCEVSIIKFHKNVSSGGWDHTCMQTGMTKLIGTFCNYVNMPKYDGVLLSEVNNGFNVALAEFWIRLMYYVYMCVWKGRVNV